MGGQVCAITHPLLKVKTSVSGAYFSAVETTADFFNRIGRLQPVATDNYRAVAEHIPKIAEHIAFLQAIKNPEDVNLRGF